VVPPAGHGQKIVTGLFGKSCADAGSATIAANAPQPMTMLAAALRTVRRK
jgi:hypothetical protein